MKMSEKELKTKWTEMLKSINELIKNIEEDIQKMQEVIDVKNRRISDLEELLTQYDPDRNNSLDDNQK